MVKYIFLWSKTLIFVVKTDFLMFRPTNFLVRSQNILVTKFLGHKISWSISIPFQCQNFMLNPIPFQFYAQLRSIPTAFHGQWQSRSTCTRSQPRLPAYLRYRLSVHWEQLQYFTDDVGSRVIRQVSWVLEPGKRITCNVRCLHNCLKSGRLWQENSAASFLSLLDVWWY